MHISDSHLTLKVQVYMQHTLRPMYIFMHVHILTDMLMLQTLFITVRHRNLPIPLACGSPNWCDVGKPTDSRAKRQNKKVRKCILGVQVYAHDYFYCHIPIQSTQINKPTRLCPKEKNMTTNSFISSKNLFFKFCVVQNVAFTHNPSAILKIK